MVSIPRTPPGAAPLHAARMGARDEPFDCVIIGGGPAGLSAAVYLGRLRRSTLVLDAHEGRSLWHQTNRNYLGFPDGIEAAELRKLGRRQAANWGTQFRNGEVASITREGGLFCIQIDPAPAPDEDPDEGSAERREEDLVDAQAVGEKQVRARQETWASTLIFATGVQDNFPVFGGSDECVGRTLFWCIICDGYEALGKQVVVLGATEEAASTALQLRQFSSAITVVAGQPQFDLPAARLEDLRAAGVTPLAGRVQDYPNDGGCISALLLDDGTRVPLDVIFTVHDKHPRSELAQALGVRCDSGGYIRADDEQKTNIPGIYAAGDVTRLHNHQISTAVHEGGMAAAAVNYYLYGTLQREQHPGQQMRDEG